MGKDSVNGLSWVFWQSKKTTNSALYEAKAHFLLLPDLHKDIAGHAK